MGTGKEASFSTRTNLVPLNDEIEDYLRDREMSVGFRQGTQTRKPEPNLARLESSDGEIELSTGMGTPEIDQRFRPLAVPENGQPASALIH